MDKGAQIWSLDAIAGVTLFLIVIVIFFIFTRNLASDELSRFDQLYDEAVIASDTLLSEGLPKDWDETNVQQVGLTNNVYRLNLTKLNRTYNLEYSRLKRLLKAQGEYLVFFEKKDGSILSVDGNMWLGKQGVTKDNIEQVEDPSRLITIRRFLALNGTIMTMVIYVWE